MKNKNTINYLDFEIERNKYERQSKFFKRANSEFRKYMKTQYKHKFGKENMIILHYPINDLNGHSILDYKFDKKRIKRKGVISLYKEIRIKFY